MELPKQPRTELTLQPLQDEEQPNESLEYFIGRIFADRGHFKNISEQSLIDEIANKQDGKDEASDQTGKDSNDAAKDPREQVYLKRAELLGYIRQAENEARLGLDFVSLLLSKDAPKQASMSMSPFLSSHVPPATLSLDKWEIADSTGEGTEEQKLVAKGWTSKSLGTTATSLEQASTRLRQQVDSESRYWDQILSISQDGWSITRAMRGSHLLGVKFSMTEASPEFARRGSAILRPDEDGNIELDHVLNYNPKTVLVQITQHGHVLGTSRHEEIKNISDHSIQSRITLARDSMFEEEMFQEIAREFRVLGSLNVMMRNSAVHVPLEGYKSNAASDAKNNSQQLKISLVPAEEKNQNVETLPQDYVSQVIISFLRLLFCEAHREKLRQQAQLPLPISEGKRQTPPVPLLRPLINHIQHFNALQSVKELSKSMKLILKSADLDMDVNADYDIALSRIAQNIRESKSEDFSVADRVIKQLMSPLNGTVIASLPSFSDSRQDRGSLRIDVYTHLASPTFGTSFRLKIPPSLTVILFNQGLVSKNLTFDNFEDLSDYLYFIYEVDMAHHLITKETSGWMPEDKWPELSRLTGSNGAKVKLAVQFTPHVLNLTVRTAESAEIKKVGSWDGSSASESFRVAVTQYTRSYPI